MAVRNLTLERHRLKPSRAYGAHVDEIGFAMAFALAVGVPILVLTAGASFDCLIDRNQTLGDAGQWIFIFLFVGSTLLLAVSGCGSEMRLKCTLFLRGVPLSFTQGPKSFLRPRVRYEWNGLVRELPLMHTPPPFLNEGEWMLLVDSQDPDRANLFRQEWLQESPDGDIPVMPTAVGGSKWRYALFVSITFAWTTGTVLLFSQVDVVEAAVVGSAATAMALAAVVAVKARADFYAERPFSLAWESHPVARKRA